jgi:chorismate mutase
MQELAEALRGVEVPVLVKNPVVADFKLWLGAIERLKRCNVADIGAVHRGFAAYEETDYSNRPRWQIPIDLMYEHPDIPIFCDPSHIGGNRAHIPVISQKAMDLNFHGLMVETHIEPDNALTDARQQLTPDALQNLLDALVIRSDNGIQEDVPLQKLRREINDLDDELIKVLGRRMRVSQQIGEFKKYNNMTILQSKRWEDLLSSHIEFGSRHGLSDEFTTRLFKIVHQESIDVQEQVFGKDD